jgi:uncharacterized protein
MVIDFRVIAPLPGPLEGYITPPEHQSGYSSMYRYQDDGPKSLEPYARDIEGASYQDRIHSRADLLRHIGTNGVPALLEMLDASGVDAVVVPGSDTRSTFGGHLPNERLAELQAEADGRLIGAAAVDPHRGMQAVRELERAVTELGLKAVTLGPWEHEIYADDRRYYPLYAKCIELGIPAIIHASTNLSPRLRMDYGHPSHLDQVAIDFPELKIVANHAGWPWVLELMAVAMRHENLFISPAGMRPKYYTVEASGWTAMLHYGNNVLKDRILWGTTWPLLPFRRTIDEINALPLRDAVREQWLGGNAVRLLELQVEARA